ncbi:hypothetical protein I350_06523 [Cryptococcus amylolentus CBS 6273]|uniref:FAS1 domain-containing protein n=1 Tax=Cryptococcus amylolentus CBS 6273 TaxID=1296118 RepID=A0A1E3JNJ5_9TREE|nr:hypothetical protein I350_06523 [Cryptococcus amylolentus CBS 6273]
MRSPSLLLLLGLGARAALSAQHAFSVDSPAHAEDDVGATLADDGRDIETAAESIISTLSASSQHTTFIRLLQRSKSVPMLAHIGNATVFAPTDQAWKEWAERNKPSSKAFEEEGDDRPDLVHGWLGPEGLDDWFQDEAEVLLARVAVSGNQEEEVRAMDNQNWALRQHLLYHMLNYTLTPKSLLASEQVNNVTLQTTLLYPLDEEPPLPPTPEPGPPWLPRGGEGLLGGHGQRLRLARVGSEEGGKRGKIGADWKGEGGVGVWDGSGWKAGNESKHGVTGVKWTRNGVVVGIEGVLDPPPSIDVIIRSHPSLSYLAKIMPLSSPPAPLPSSFATTPHLTVFAPSNEAFLSAFDDIERGYLEGPYGDEGVGRIVGQNVVLGQDGKGVGWSDLLGKESDFEAASGLHLNVSSPSRNEVLVNDTKAEIIDIFASNGVIHIIPNLILPAEFDLLNSAEKMLLSLNATRFVSLLRTANLSDAYIGKGSAEKGGDSYTILAPTDDVLDTLDKWGGLSAASSNHILAHEMTSPSSISPIGNTPFKDVSPLAALLQYHILPGKLLPQDLKDGQLLPTEMRTSALGGERQRLRVEVAEKDGSSHSDWETVGEGKVRLGGATVVGKPVKSGNNIIYLISGLLSTPDNVLQTAVSDLQLSTFVAALYAADLAKTTKHYPATTYLIPHNDAFNHLGLTMKWLLLPDGKDDLRKVIKYHAVDGLVYSQDVNVGRQVYKTVEGGDIVIERGKGKHGALTVGSPNKWSGHDSFASLPSNGELFPANISTSDALTDTGVIHTIDQVVMPADVGITIAKLVKGSKQSTMADLMSHAGLGWILEGREPSGEEVTRVALEGWVRAADEGGEGGSEGEGESESLAYPAYTVLVPTDKAFGKLNLTYYTNNPPALLDLLKLHIIPSQTQLSSSSSSSPLPPPPETIPQEGQPLLLMDDTVYGTLLSSRSKFADLAFRNAGDGSWIVGIQNARNGAGGDSARVGASGRASVRWRNPSAASKGHKDKHNAEGDDEGGDGDDEEWKKLWRGGMTLGGGVLIIDSVLVPYEISWFSRWGFLTVTLSGIGILLVATAGSIGYWFWTREKEGYEPILVEEEGEGEEQV